MMEEELEKESNC